MTRAEREQAVTGRMEALFPAWEEQFSRQLVTYYEMLADWNTRMNLTGDTDFEVILAGHFEDSLAPLQIGGLFPTGAALIDVGSGAGFPGLPIAIARPDMKVTLLDSLAKRVGFLKAVSQELGLANVECIHARAEEGAKSPALRETFDIAVARAVAPISVLCELLLPFVGIGGRMICYKGPAAAQEQAAGARTAALLGGGEMEVHEVNLPSRPDWGHRVVVSQKKEKTASQYPRKPGTPARSPLGEEPGH